MPARRSQPAPRRLRYSVATSLDGYIARRNGEMDWIVADPAIDFAAMYKEYDTAIMGRKTWDAMAAMGGQTAMPGLDVLVFSRTAAAVTRPSLRITNEDPVAVVKQLKAKRGKDIWLFGGGELFRVLLAAGLVDTVEVAVIPVLLGEGIPLLPPGASTTLELVDQKTLPRSGIIVLSYSVPGGVAPASPIHHVRNSRPAAARKTRSRSRKTHPAP
jgi:dihydrofolate reductase